MTDFLVAALQITSTSNVEANFIEAEEQIELAARRGAELIGLPENFAFLGGDDEKLRLANLSFSSSPPKKAKFSGNPINSAPLLAANSICSSASMKFASTFEVLVICNAATKKSVKTLLLVNQFVNHEARITPLST